MRRIAILGAGLLGAALLGACELPSGTDSPGAADRAAGPCPDGAVCVAGTVRHFAIEGGFWAIRGDDSVTYDPSSELPTEFRTEGLRVHLTARPRPDLAGFHMAGPIVDVLALRRL
jgi:hypothetical protein